jgi:hypothetical protein
MKSKITSILILIVAIGIVEFGLIFVFMDSAMGNRNIWLQNSSFMSAFLFPFLLIPGITKKYRKHIAIISLMAAFACGGYLTFMNGLEIFVSELVVIPLGFILTIILLAFLLRKEPKEQN